MGDLQPILEFVLSQSTHIYISYLWPLPFIYAVMLRFILANRMPLNTEFKMQNGVFLSVGVLASLAVRFANPKISAPLFLIVIIALGVVFRRLCHINTAIEIIRSSNIIYKTTNTDGDVKETKIKSKMTGKNTRFIAGWPVFGRSFTFRMENTSTPEEAAKVKGQLIRYFPNYIFDIVREGSKYKILAQANKGKLKPLPFPVNLSKTLPFYAIPLGAIDGSSKRRSVETPYIWLMNTDYDLPKRRDLSKAKFLSKDSAPHGLIVGGTRGGKSVLLYSLILHLAITNKADLYIIDPKGTEFNEFKDYPFVKGYCGPSIFEAQAIMEEFLTAQDKRYYTMSSLGVKNLAAVGDVVNLGHNWIIDGWGVKGNQPMKIKYNGKEQTISLNNLDLTEGFEIFIPAKTWKSSDGQWVTATKENTQHGGKYEFRPLIMICDEYSKLVESTNGREEQRVAMDFQTGVDLIAKLGGAADIHIVLATQSANMNMFPTAVRNNIHFRNICGWVEPSVSNGVIGSEQGSSIPKIPGSYLAYIRDETVFYRGYFTSEKDIKKVLGKIGNGKKKQKEDSQSEILDPPIEEMNEVETQEIQEEKDEENLENSETSIIEDNNETNSPSWDEELFDQICFGDEEKPNESDATTPIYEPSTPPRKILIKRNESPAPKINLRRTTTPSSTTTNASSALKTPAPGKINLKSRK